MNVRYSVSRLGHALNTPAERRSIEQNLRARATANNPHLPDDALHKRVLKDYWRSQTTEESAQAFARDDEKKDLRAGAGAIVGGVLVVATVVSLKYVGVNIGEFLREAWYAVGGGEAAHTMGSIVTSTEIQPPTL